MSKETITSPCGCELTTDQVETLWGRYRRSLSPGRPRESNRCPCGVMTKLRAIARGHKCVRGKKSK